MNFGIRLCLLFYVDRDSRVVYLEETSPHGAKMCEKGHSGTNSKIQGENVWGYVVQYHTDDAPLPANELEWRRPYPWKTTRYERSDYFAITKIAQGYLFDLGIEQAKRYSFHGFVIVSLIRTGKRIKCSCCDLCIEWLHCWVYVLWEERFAE